MSSSKFRSENGGGGGDSSVCSGSTTSSGMRKLKLTKRSSANSTPKTVVYSKRRTTTSALHEIIEVSEKDSKHSDIVELETTNTTLRAPEVRKQKSIVSEISPKSFKKWRSLLSFRNFDDDENDEIGGKLQKSSVSSSIISTIYRGGNGGHKMSYSRREVKKAQKLFVIVVFFMLCWIPLYTSNTVLAFCNQCSPPSATLLDYLIILSHINSAGSPFLYAFHMKDFRDALHRLICKGAINKQKIRELRREELFTGTGRFSRTTSVDGNLRPTVSDFYLYHKHHSPYRFQPNTPKSDRLAKRRPPPLKQISSESRRSIANCEIECHSRRFNTE